VIMHNHTIKWQKMKTNNNKQVAAFDQVLGHCNALGTKYNPSKDSIKVAALNTLLTSAKATLTAADTAKFNLMEAVNVRQETFAPITKTATRILNVLIASDASPQRIADVRKYRDKLSGKRQVKTMKPEASTTPAPPADASRGPISYLDFESKIDSFSNILELVKAEPLYKPNEVEFSIANLTTLLATLRLKNKAVHDAQVALRNARLNCNATVYSDAGLYGAAKRVKKYILFAFGATSKQYHMFNGIHLKTR
jgi:hypothetical protein